MIALREDIFEEKSLINKILNEDVIRKTNNFKSYTCEKNGKRYYYSYMLDMDSFVFDFEIRKLETYIESNKENYLENNLEYSAVLCPRDGETLPEIVEKLNLFSKGK